MSIPGTPTLFLLAAAPGVLALALGAFMLSKGWARALGATLISVGLSLSSLILLVAISFSFGPLNSLVDYPFLLLGIPLILFVTALSLFFRRAGTSLLTMALWATAGLSGLYWAGGFVLMQSACSFHSGGC
jgi:hypothetical protein